MKYYVFIGFIILCLAKNTNAQDSTRVKKIKILPVPTFGYAPETKTYVGAVSLFTLNFHQASNTRASNAKVGFTYTWNKQVIVESEWNYFFDKEAWCSRGQLHFSKYPDLYYGIGTVPADSSEIRFESNRAIVDIGLLKKRRDGTFLGLGIRYLNYGKLDFYEKENPYQELEDEVSYGLKFIFLKDSRNNLLNATKGSYFEFVNTQNIADQYYTIFAIDLRKYFTLKKNEHHTFAGRFYYAYMIGAAPFYDYPAIGGDKFVRGYLYGRYRDKTFTTLQLEYRFKVFWRFGLATFGGISAVYPAISVMNKDSIKPNIGLGIRFLVDKTEHTNLRLDYAIGSNGQSGFYVSFGESF